MKILYIIYQICIGLPIFLVLTILTALTTMIGCWLGNGHFWGYYPGKIWSQLTCWLFLLPVSVEGHEKIDHRTSYVFLANHQGAFDIRISGKKLQMDDEKKSPQSSFCRKGMRIGRFHFCR